MREAALCREMDSLQGELNAAMADVESFSGFILTVTEGWEASEESKVDQTVDVVDVHVVE